VVKDFPYFWKHKDIQAIVQPTEFGQVQIKWIDDQSAYFIFDKSLIENEGVHFVMNLFQDKYGEESSALNPSHTHFEGDQKSQDTAPEQEDGELSDPVDKVQCKLASQGFVVQTYSSYKQDKWSHVANPRDLKRRRVD
jgi:hypothetical protein